jgi:arylsulfatase A-like enzyme
MDIYPTLLELAGLEADSLHEGRSLVRLLEERDADWSYFARTSFGPGNYAIVSEQYRYIHYNDGSEEFYDRSSDPHEWSNLIDSSEFQELISLHRDQVPLEHHTILGKNSTGHKAFFATEELMH